MGDRRAQTANPDGRFDRPAFYALRAGGWRDLVTLLHPPYTAWHLSYVALGAAAAPAIHLDRLLATLAAFFLAVGVAAHALDELNGHPLRTRLSDRSLVALAAISLAGAIAIGIAGVFIFSPTLAPFVVVGGFLVVAYNLELAGGRFHTDFWFAAGVGRLPRAYVVVGQHARARTPRSSWSRGWLVATGMLRSQRGAAAPLVAGP